MSEEEHTITLTETEVNRILVALTTRRNHHNREGDRERGDALREVARSIATQVTQDKDQ